MFFSMTFYVIVYFREVYEYMRQRHKEKGRSKTVKGESFTLQQLQTAREEYDDEATLFVFRLKSLKQGQCHSLLTQAARHHAAQVQLSISRDFLFFHFGTFLCILLLMIYTISCLETAVFLQEGTSIS